MTGVAWEQLCSREILRQLKGAKELEFNGQFPLTMQFEFVAGSQNG